MSISLLVLQHFLGPRVAPRHSQLKVAWGLGHDELLSIQKWAIPLTNSPVGSHPLGALCTRSACPQNGALISLKSSCGIKLEIPGGGKWVVDVLHSLRTTSALSIPPMPLNSRSAGWSEGDTAHPPFKTGILHIKQVKCNQVQRRKEVVALCPFHQIYLDLWESFILTGVLGSLLFFQSLKIRCHYGLCWNMEDPLSDWAPNSFISLHKSVVHEGCDHELWNSQLMWGDFCKFEPGICAPSLGVH